VDFNASFILPISLLRFIKNPGIQTVMPVPCGCERVSSDKEKGKHKPQESSLLREMKKGFFFFSLPENSWEIKL
jgi:hypothetical protein